MTPSDTTNTNLQKAISFVNQTSMHLFLTGKAGTGKTTFLKYIKEHSYKKLAIVAPTGVAAINAGGVTIHSMFQLPMGAFLPTQKNNWDVYNGRFNNQHSLIKNLRLSSAKRTLLKEIDLLVIDEVSMVRADTLDAIDAVLRHVRKQQLIPFGGVQVLYIGDLFQLPPVVKNDEWDVLKEYYDSPFFFNAQAIQQAPPVYIELKKIYRQSDEAFISILNNIRNNTCTRADLEHLHQHYQPDFVPPVNEHYITLTSHNEKADAINRRELAKLPGKTHAFKAEVTGEFYDRSFPAEEVLNLKEGAQVMFIKNDKGENRKFYNGKIGVIERIADSKIYVSFPDEADELELEQETWQNIKYNYDKDKDKIEEEELGTFKQYPVRLAWAVTIHKSQGLTFAKAIIDAGSSFAPGQVYVALSRLTSLTGLVLHSRIAPSAISTDYRVLNFVKNEWPEDKLQQVLEQQQQHFVKESLLKGFNWQKTEDAVLTHLQMVKEKYRIEKEHYIDMAIDLHHAVNELNEVSQKFCRQLDQLYVSANGGYQQLQTRTKAAAEYFTKGIDEKLIAPLDQHLEEIKDEKKIKKYVKEMLELKRTFLRQKQLLQHTQELANALAKADSDVLQRAQEIHQPIVIEEVEEEIKKETARAPKGETARISLQMFKDGKSIAEISAERNLAFSTIEGHLANFIPSGEIDVHELISPAKLENIMEVLKKEKEIPPSTVLKGKLSADISYGDIKAALKYWEKENPV